LEIRFQVPVNTTATVGQTLNASPRNGNPIPPNSASVLYSDVGGDVRNNRVEWRASSGTITLVRFTAGVVGAGRPGQLQFQFDNVLMVPIENNRSAGPFTLNGLLTATSGNPGTVGAP
jgi:hypothetical protein